MQLGAERTVPLSHPTAGWDEANNSTPCDSWGTRPTLSGCRHSWECNHKTDLVASSCDSTDAAACLSSPEA